MDEKMRLVYCIPALYNPGGMERVLTLKANYFAEHLGYEVHIVVTDGKGRTPFYALHPAIAVHQLDVNFDALEGVPLLRKGMRYVAKQRLFRKRLSACLHALKADVVVSLLRRDINFINDIRDGSIKVGEIHFNRSNYRDFTDNRFPVFLQKLGRYVWNRQLIGALKKLDAFVVLSYEDAAYWPELSHVSVIHNPLSFYPDTPSPLEAKQVIAVGRYVPQKGFDRLIDAWSRVVQKHADWVLKIYGDGMREPLQEQIERLGLADSCFLEPTVPDIVDRYRESSVFVLSSRYEGFGMVITEAMACGVPPVAFACPCGPRDIIQDGIDGFLVEEGDVEMLADKIGRLIQDEGLRQRMGRHARLHVKRFGMEQVALQWKALFEKLLQEKSRVGSVSTKDSGNAAGVGNAISSPGAPGKRK